MKTAWRKARRPDQEIYYFDAQRTQDWETCGYLLFHMIKEICQEENKEGVVILCIGTDRSTGDSLGPLIGYKLRQQRVRRVKIMGTLDAPVHAVNLSQSMEKLRLHYPNHAVVAVDASVGRLDHVGCITVGKGSLRPGLGVSKELQAVGDIFVTGIVGGYGHLDPLMLQSVRLSIVMSMAEYICNSIFFVEQLFDERSVV